jgi:hypothetical protein
VPRIQSTHIRKLSLLLFCLAFLWLGSTAFFSWQTLHWLKKHKLSEAANAARWTNVLTKPITFFLSPISPDVKIAVTSLELIDLSDRLHQSLQKYVPTITNSDLAGKDYAKTLHTEATALITTSQTWLDLYPRSPLFRKATQKAIPSALQTWLDTQPTQLSQYLEQTQILLDHFLVGKHRYVILLQNSDELRATGGFMGSYALLELDEGQVNKLEVQDIYVPDGQYIGFTEAPPGLKEYLSGGKGFRLPDANWNPDFPSSAQDILKFFALGKETEIEGIVAVNVSIVERLLQLTGPLYLPDYDQTVTSQNLAELARADRDQFFPGSQQKRRFLQAVLTQLKLRLPEAPLDLGTAVALIHDFRSQKDVQIFSKAPQIQEVVQQLGFDGQIKLQNHSRYLFLVESNVGINKTNQLIDREVDLKIDEYQTTVEVSFVNKNPISTLPEQKGDYINYQRLFIPADHRVRSIQANGESLDRWDEQLVTTVAGHTLKQVGFLITVPAQSSENVTIELTHPSLPTTQIAVQKQSGLKPVLYSVQTGSSRTEFLLTSDTVFSPY